MNASPFESKRAARVLGVVAILLLLSFTAQKIRAQAPPSGRTLPESFYNAGRPPELTYTNSVYGFSFRFPSNFNLRLGNGNERSFAPHSDPGETLLASVMNPRSISPTFLFVGVNPKISTESCAALVAPDEWTSGAPLKLTTDGVEFKGRFEVEKSKGTGEQFGILNILQRQYTGFSNGVCYEFQIYAASADPSRYRNPPPKVDFDRVFAAMEEFILKSKFGSPSPGAVAAGPKAVHVTKPWETSLAFPKELAGLDDLTDWTISYPGAFRQQVCGTGESGSYMPISFVHGADPTLNDADANAAVNKLVSQITQLVQENGWEMRSDSCYTKGQFFVVFFKGTDRCTMNSGPCAAYDELQVIVDVPEPAGRAAQ